MHIPIIDLSNPSTSTSEEILSAATEWGFLYIRFKSLPFSTNDVNKLFSLSSTFYQTPISAKKPYSITPADVGWSGPYNETLTDDNTTAASEPGDFKEAFNIGEFRNGISQQSLPPVLAAQAEFLHTCQQRCRALCLLILEHIAAALAIPDDGDDMAGRTSGRQFFSSRHEAANGATGSILRLLYYPSLPPSGVFSSSSAAAAASHTDSHTSTATAADQTPTHKRDPPRCGAHTDYGSLTLLFQLPGQGGLEIVSPGGEWMPVAVFPPGTENDEAPPVVVNIGDMLQFWTGGVLRSTRHRVVLPVVDGSDAVDDAVGGGGGMNYGSKERYSIAYFCHPAQETRLVAVPCERVRVKVAAAAADTENGEGGGASQKEVITAGEHLRRKLDRAYRWTEKSN